ncbi:MAG: GNAT family N-acetyltransferase [Clostridia bacterium]|nr:GNAT family N-acetyltransferase [Clostridia bacterium]
MRIAEEKLTDELTSELISLSSDWEAEGSTYGYRANGREDVAGNRVFTARDGERLVGYLFGHVEESKRATSIMPDGTPFFEIEELYVVPLLRSQGIGRALFELCEKTVKNEVGFLMLSTATKDHKAILHFYIDELGMDFWSARLFKMI